MSKIYYVVSTFWYPSADEVDNEDITTEINAAKETLDEALDIIPDIVGACGGRSQTMSWNPIKGVLTVRMLDSSTIILVTRVES